MENTETKTETASKKLPIILEKVVAGEWDSEKNETTLNPQVAPELTLAAVMKTLISVTQRNAELEKEKAEREQVKKEETKIEEI